jgi:hypothetical protein
VTDSTSIERWWELVFCASSLVSFQCPALQSSQEASEPPAAHEPTPVDRFPKHPWWDSGQGWKNTLNNLRLILQPYVYSCLLLPWLLLFDIPVLRTGFAELTGIMNLFHASLPICFLHLHSEHFRDSFLRFKWSFSIRASSFFGWGSEAPSLPHLLQAVKASPEGPLP